MPRASQPSPAGSNSSASSRPRLVSWGGAVGADRVEAAQRQLRRNLRVICDQRLILGRYHRQFVIEPLGVGEAQRPLEPLRLDPVALQALLPKGKRVLGRPPARRSGGPSPAPARPGGTPGVLKEGEVRSGAALLVGEEEVIDGRVVLVDGLLDQAEAEHSRVEVDVALGVLGYRGYVVDSLELHPVTYSILRMSRGRRRTVKALVATRFGPRLPQRLLDLGRTPGAQHQRLGKHQRPATAELDDPQRGRPITWSTRSMNTSTSRRN